jgi:hypothetical protein
VEVRIPVAEEADEVMNPIGELNGVVNDEDNDDDDEEDETEFEVEDVEVEVEVAKLEDVLKGFWV